MTFHNYIGYWNPGPTITLSSSSPLVITCAARFGANGPSDSGEYFAIINNVAYWWDSSGTASSTTVAIPGGDVSTCGFFFSPDVKAALITVAGSPSSDAKVVHLDFYQRTLNTRVTTLPGFKGAIIDVLGRGTYYSDPTAPSYDVFPTNYATFVVVSSTSAAVVYVPQYTYAYACIVSPLFSLVGEEIASLYTTNPWATHYGTYTGLTASNKLFVVSTIPVSTAPGTLEPASSIDVSPNTLVSCQFDTATSNPYLRLLCLSTPSSGTGLVYANTNSLDKSNFYLSFSATMTVANLPGGELPSVHLGALSGPNAVYCLRSSARGGSYINNVAASRAPTISTSPVHHFPGPGPILHPQPKSPGPLFSGSSPMSRRATQSCFSPTRQLFSS
jgi:hypothetical protein